MKLRMHPDQIQNFPLLRGDSGVYYLAVLLMLLMSGSSSAQKKAVQPEVLYSNLSKPGSIYATQNHLFVVESGKNRVLKFDHFGQLIESFGGLGSNDYQFDNPIDIDATNGLKIYVSDNRNNRIQIFDRHFQYLSTLKRYPRARSSRPVRPTQLGVNSFGELFFYDQDSNCIISVDEKGNKLDEFIIPNAVREVSDLQVVGKDLYILDLKSKKYHILTYNGVQARSFPLDGAVQVFVDRKGEEWLIYPSSIQNSRNPEVLIEFPQDIVIKDVTKINGIFYILTNKSMLSVAAE